MGYMIFEKAKKYKVIHVAILTLLFILAYRLIFSYVSDSDSRLFPLITNTALIYLSGIVLAVLWGMISVSVLLLAVYTQKTHGRNYTLDKKETRRTYFELLRFYKDADPYKLKAEELPVKDWRDAEGVILGKLGKRLLYYPSDTSKGDGKNFALFARPGGGKTTAQIIPSALRFGGSVLAVDIKGDILNAAKGERKIKVFSPANPEESCSFNPLDGIEKLTVSERKTFIEQISHILVRDEKEGKYFTEGARDFFCGVSLYLLHENIKTSFPDIAKAILHSNSFAWAKKIASGDCIEAQEYTNSYIGSNEKNVAGAYNAIAKAVRPFSSGELSQLLANEKDCLSPATLDEGFDIYIEIPQDKVSVYAPITTILIQNFMTFFMQRPDNSFGKKLRPILFLLDEFPQLGFDFATLSAGLSTLRSKNVSIFLAQQSIAQLTNRYGDEGCREIIDTCSYVSVMSAQDPSSRKFFQELFGTKKVLRMTSSESNLQDVSSAGSLSRGSQETREPVFQPEDFSNLGDNLVVYASGKHIIAQKTYYFEERKRRKLR